MRIPWWLFAFLGVAVIWGSSFALIEVALTAFSPSQITVGRLLLGALTLAVLLLAMGKFPNLRQLDLKSIAFIAATTAAGFILTAVAQMHITSSSAGLLNASVPLWTALFVALLVPRERPSGKQLSGLIVGFAGMFVLVEAWEIFTGNAINFVGTLALLGATCCYGLGSAVARWRLADSKASNMQLCMVQLSIAAVLTTLSLPIGATTVQSSPTFGAIASVVLLGVLSGAVAFVLFWYLMSKTGAVTSASVYYAMPVVACIVGVVFLNETLQLAQVIGAVVVVAGIVLSMRQLPQAQEEQTGSVS